MSRGALLLHIFAGLILAAITLLLFWDPASYIFQMPDDYLYSEQAASFLRSFEYHWAGSKPGTVLVAALFGGVTPQRIMYVFLFFGLLSIFALWFLSLQLFEHCEIALVPPLLWASSPFLFYFSHTHNIIWVPFYLGGLCFVLRGLRSERMQFYRIGFVLWGWSIFCYYLALTYILPVFAIFICVSYFSRSKWLRMTMEGCFFLILPIIVMDSIVFLLYILWGKKNWPLFYSLFFQLKNLTFFPTLRYGFAYYPQVFMSLDILLFIGCILGVCTYFYRVVRQNHANDRLAHAIMTGFLIVLGYLFLRPMYGSLSALRMFSGLVPIFCIFTVYFFQCMVSMSMRQYLVFITLCFTVFRVYQVSASSSLQLHSGYYNVAQSLERDADVVLYMGWKVLWEQLLDQKKVIALNSGDNPFSFFDENSQLDTFITFLEGYAKSALKTYIVVSNIHEKKADMLLALLKSHFNLETIYCKENPHVRSRFVLEETNYEGAGALERLENRQLAYIGVYKISCK